MAVKKTLFDEKWKKEWRGMPEFVQEEIEPFRRMTVYFRCQEDVDEFAKLVDQENITDKTKFIWYPKQIRKTHRSDLRYVDEEPIEETSPKRRMRRGDTTR